MDPLLFVSMSVPRWTPDLWPEKSGRREKCYSEGLGSLSVKLGLDGATCSVGSVAGCPKAHVLYILHERLLLLLLLWVDVVVEASMVVDVHYGEKECFRLRVPDNQPSIIRYVRLFA